MIERMADTTTITTPDQLRAEAAQHEQDAHDSFDRCDTDGFLSQWASGQMAGLKRMQATIAERGGTYTFPALFDLDGNIVAAKLIDGRYGPVWGVLADDDPSGRVVEWVTAFPVRESTMRRKGYYEGEVDAPAYAVHRGSNVCTVTAVAERRDGGFSRDVVIVDNGQA